MNNIRNFWKRLWNEHADSDSIFGRVDFSKYYEISINSKLCQSTHMFDIVREK